MRYVCGILVGAALVLGACTSNSTPTELPTGPSMVSVPSQSSGGGSTTFNGSGQTLPKGCNVLSITARRVIEVRPGEVSILVTVDYDGDGEPYVKVIDRKTGRRIGRYVPGGITIQGLSPGSYDLQIFVEVEDSQGFFQCDGGLQFDIPKPPEPPKKTCEERNKPRTVFLGGQHCLTNSNNRRATAQVKVCNKNTWLKLKASRGERTWVKDREDPKVACEDGCEIFTLTYYGGHVRTHNWWVEENGQVIGRLQSCQGDNQ